MPDRPPTLLRKPSLTPWSDPVLSRVPGMQPVDGPVFRRDACFAAQMALRDDLVATRWSEVAAALEGAEAEIEECLEYVLAELRTDPEYFVDENTVTRPDGASVPLDDPLRALGRLVVEDLLILNGPNGAHTLKAGVLAFPSRWSVTEKLGRDLLSIHRPVPFYPDDIAPRVQRLFDVLRSDRPLWRANWLFYSVPDHFTPGTEGNNSGKPWEPDDPLYFRTERQTLLRLPRTGAVVFVIKTDICAMEDIPDDALAALPDALLKLPPVEAAYKSVEHVLPLVEAERVRRASA